MTRLPRFALLTLALAAGSAAAQEIQFFERPDFNGRRFSASGAVSNMQQTGFNDRAESLVIRSGQWQICSDAQFRGRCVTLNPGEYRSLAQIGLANQVSSARQTGGWGGGGGGGGSARGLTLYEGGGFSGRVFEVEDDVSNLARTGFNDRARSMVIQGGEWEVCVDADYRNCQRLGPGRYANLGGLGGELSSMRRVGGGGQGGGWDAPDGWGTQSRVVLFANPNLDGRAYVVRQDELQNFQSLGFNDRASSLRVEGGYWMFCSDSNYRGTCRTFGPGDYATLPAGLNNAISSGRRIHNDYPYQQNPSWGGYSQQ